MNPVIVVDASAAIKWVVEEEFSEQAEALLQDAQSSTIIGPPTLLTEVTNAIYQRTRRRDPTTRLTAEEAQAALDRFLALGVRIEASHALYREAFGFARQQALPNVYDTLYVVLARLLATELWTDDRRLLDAVRGVAPWVRWIRDYPLPAQ